MSPPFARAENRPRMSRRLLLASLLGVAACAPGDDLEPLPPLSEAGYRLGAGDQVRIITFGEQQLTGEFRVADSGTIAVPLIGAVRAAGLTARQLGDAVAAELKRRQLFRDPSVVVEVIAYRPVFVLGEVNKPGQFAYQPQMSVLTVVAIAGGFTYRAVRDRASVLRTTDGRAVEGLATTATLLQPGDVVTILERNF